MGDRAEGPGKLEVTSPDGAALASHAHGVHGHSHGEGPLAGAAAYAFRAASDHREALLERGSLGRGSGRGRVLFFDCPSGISGDMTLAALLDLGVPLTTMDEAIAALGLAEEARLVVQKGHAGVIFATRVEVELSHPSPPRTYASIRTLIEGSSLNDGTRAAALAVFERLARAEARVHGTTPSAVSFHEVGATDSIVDIVGAAAGFDFLGAEWVVSPLPLGRGFADSQHGRLPLPAPATLLCLEGVPTVSDPLDVELVTPTGAAIVASLAARFESWPPMVPEKVGWGAGTLVLPDRPNALRVVLGTQTGGSDGADRALLLEANVDDMTGEVLAHALTRLLEAGALDAWISPITMKKGRPAFTLSALVYPDRAPEVERAYFDETTTLGVRRREVLRTLLEREVVVVQTRFGPVPVKQSGSPPKWKPEFDVCVTLAAKYGVAVRVVLDEALAQARSSR